MLSTLGLKLHKVCRPWLSYWFTLLIYDETYVFMYKIRNKYCFLLCRETFSTNFPLYSVQRLLKEVEGKNMWGEDGLILLVELINFLRRRNGNSGPFIFGLPIVS